MKKRIKKVITSLTVFSMLFSILTMNTKSNTVVAQGVDKEGYTLIETPAELDTLLRSNLSGKFKLKNDIDLTNYISKTNPANGGWVPTGIFKGTFDGAGYTIKGLWLGYTTNYAGLFSQTNNATIRNLNIELGSAGIVAKGSMTGGITGCARNMTTIENCKISGGSITGYGNYTGGIAGYVGDQSTVKNVYVNTPVGGYYYAGGIVGFLEGNSTVYMAGVDSLVGATYNYAGGIASVSKGSTISNCYSGGSVIGMNAVGGLVGHASTSIVENCYVSGAISSASKNDATYNGIFMGFSDVTYRGTNYYDSAIGASAGMPRAYGYGAKGTASTLPQGKSTSDMKKKATFVGWDFNTIWRVDENKSYPYFDICKANTGVTITFDRNNVEAIGTMGEQKAILGVANTLNANAFSYAGHRFLGWSTTPTGSVVYADGATITPTQDMTLYAVWGTPDLYASLTPDRTTGNPGDLITFTGVLGNRIASNSSPVFDTVIYFYLYDNVTYVDGSVTIRVNGRLVTRPTTYDPVTKTIKVEVGVVNPGEEYVFTYGVRLGNSGQAVFNNMGIEGNVNPVVARSTAVKDIALQVQSSKITIK